MVVVFAENIQTEMKEHELEYGMQIELYIETEKEILLVRKNRIGNSLEKKLSTKLMGVYSGKVFTAPVVGGGG